MARLGDSPWPQSLHPVPASKWGGNETRTSPSLFSQALGLPIALGGADFRLGRDQEHGKKTGEEVAVPLQAHEYSAVRMMGTVETVTFLGLEVTLSCQFKNVHEPKLPA